MRLWSLHANGDIGNSFPSMRLQWPQTEAQMFYLHTHITGGMAKVVLWRVDALLPLWIFHTLRYIVQEKKMSKIIAETL